MKKKLLKIFACVFVLAFVFALPMCAEESLTGDMNGDGAVNSDDAIYLLRHTLDPDKYPLACNHALTKYEAKEATCEEAGHNAYEECSKCGYTTYQEIEALNHKNATEEIVKKGEILKDGLKKISCPDCSMVEEIVIPATKSIKILAIGNSFSVDATTYLYDLFVAAGVENVTVGNAYISGCSISKHYKMAQSGEAAYKYYKFTKDGNTDDPANLTQIVSDEKWDIITLQQASPDSGRPDSYGDLENLIGFVLDTCSNPNVDLRFHMTWAYQNDYESSGFENYDSDQTTMYNAIVDTVKNVPLKNDKISCAIPAGTAVQNLRTSYIGDNLTRDGYHMSYGIGRYTVALTWVCSITGASPDEINWVPSSQQDIAVDLAPIREAIKNAIAAPFEVTNSKITEKPELTLEDRFTMVGLDIEEYELIDWEPKLSYTWNSTNRTTANVSTSLPQFIASKKFAKAELPIGTVIVVDDGYQYRPEGWQTADAVNSGARPGECTSYFTVVTEEWWGDFNYRAFNVSMIGKSEAATDEDATHFKIYVPKLKGQFAAAGLDIEEYELIDWEPKLSYAWNSTKRTTATDSSSLPQFIASKKFTKDELPTGTVIVVDDGYQYRPEGWQTADAVNSNTRPGNSSIYFTVVDEEWWENYNYRAFNVSKIDSTAPATEEDVKHFNIYIPKEQGE